jgi:hypothetical protein
LLVESVGGTLERVPEDEARLFQDGKFVALLQFATLISAYQRVVDECAVPREILDNCDHVATLLFSENQAMPVRDGV